jgi:dTDP-4-amino-4,6-dideoxygalactose transaminase
MIPYGRQDISQSDIDSVVEVLRSDFLTQGPMVPRFERAVAQYCSAQHAVAVNSATSALHIACLALGVGPGDWVWTSPNTFVASANCALYSGAGVDFVDIDCHTYNMSVERLEEKLSYAKKKGCLPKVLIPVHFAGQPCDMSTIYALSKDYGFRILEDASHAIGARYATTNGDRSPDADLLAPKISRQDTDKSTVGSCAYSDITVFSFHPVKIITSGEGGMVTTNDETLAARMRRLRSHGITSDEALMQKRPKEEIWNYQQIELGFNYRMTDIQAALGLSQLTRLDEFVRCRHKIAKRYNERLEKFPLIIPVQAKGIYSSYHLYPIRIEEYRCKRSQRKVFDALREKGVAANLHYIPVYRHPYYEALGFRAGKCPEAERFYSEAVSLPIYCGLESDVQDSVIGALVEILEL